VGLTPPKNWGVSKIFFDPPEGAKKPFLPPGKNRFCPRVKNHEGIVLELRKKNLQ